MSEQYIIYEAQLRVMKCRLCKEGITKNGIAYHYRNDHKQNVSLQARKALVKYCNDFDIYTKDDFQYPKTIITAIEERVVEKGLRCLFDDCYYACICLSAMEIHCKKKHDWVTSKGITLRYPCLTSLYRSYVDWP
jgi:Orsellinic acid/F9775 biosynthesis cluster protein D